MRETVTVSENAAPVKRSWFARIPVELLKNRALCDETLRVYGILAAFVPKGSNLANVGQRLIGEHLGLSAATVCRRLKDLESMGLISRGATRNGERAFWQMNSPVFSSEVAAKPRVAGLRGCAKCSRVTKVGAAGMCRPCKEKLTRQKVYAAAVANLGPAASHEDVCAKIQVDKLSEEWLDAARSLEREKVA